MTLTPNQTILNGKYHIVRLIGEGGAARVWLAEEPRFENRQVAIKELRRDLLTPGDLEEQERRFYQEVRLAALLEQANAPHTVRAITVEEMEDGVRLLVMVYCDGGSLADLIKAHPQGMPIDQAVRVAVQVCEALEALHNLQLGPVHRDVKPANILLTNKGEALLSDFGLAQLPGETIGRSKFAAGPHPATLQYAAPEQLRGPESLLAAADVFALGCVLWEMLTGQRYKRHKPDTRPGRLRANTPAWLDRVVMKALTEDPWERWQTAGDMAAALREGNSGGRSRAWLGWAGGAIALMAVLVVTLWVLLTGGTGAQGDATSTPLSPAAAEVAQATASGTSTPTETSTPTRTSIPSTNTPAPLVDTLPPPTKTPVPSPVTPIPPTDTPVRIIDTPVTPTRTPVPPTDTPIPPTPTPLPDAVVNTQNANLRAGPGTVYNVLDSYPAGTEIEIVGKNAAGDWLETQTSSGQTGWMADSVLKVNANLDDVIVVAAPPTPTKTRDQYEIILSQDSLGAFIVQVPSGVIVTTLTNEQVSSAEPMLNGNILVVTNSAIKELNDQGNVVRQITRPRAYTRHALPVGDEGMWVFSANDGSDNTIKYVEFMDWAGNVTVTSSGYHYPFEVRQRDNGNLLIADGTSTLTEIDTQGNVMRKIGMTSWAGAVCPLDDGTMLVGRPDGVALLDQAGQELRVLRRGRVTSIDALPWGNFLIADMGSQTISEIDSAGTTLWSVPLTQNQGLSMVRYYGSS